MGYDTSFHGAVTITPPLSYDEVQYLRAFNESRRMKRNADMTAKYYDPLRELVALPVGDEGGYYVDAHAENMGQKETPDIIDYSSPPAGQPGLWCGWTPTEDGAAIEWDGGEKFYNYVEWMEYLIEHFIKPWGHVAEGEITWQGEDSDDRGTIFVKDNVVEAVLDDIRKGKPSWA